MARTDLERNDDSGQAAFIGWLALVLMVLAVLAGAAVILTAVRFDAISGGSRVDQAGSSDPAALPSPQAARPTPTNPKAAPTPPSSEMPAAGQQAPAAAANQQPEPAK